ADLSAPTPAGTLKRPTSLSRHASAAGFPLSPAIPRGLGKAAKAYSPCDGGEGSLMEPEEISQLLADVTRLAEPLEKLRDVVLREDGLESRRALAHESLGDALRILRQVVAKYPLLNTLETLTAAGTLISKVKGFHYESNIEADKREFEKALETIAVSFSGTVSELLMGEVDSSTLLSIPPSDHNQVRRPVRLSAEEVDVLLQRCEGGVEAALHYAKNVSKYMKDLMYYLEKRTALEMEFAKGLQKMVHSCKQTISQEPFMPFFSIYSLALEQDAEFGVNSQQAAVTLRSETFLQPLATRRLKHEKRRKEVKEQWHRAQRKLQEAESNLRKARQMYMQRSEESEKAKDVMVKAEEEQLGSSVGSSTAATKALDKKRRLEEEARNKADEAMATYRTCIADANTQKQELEDTKVTALRQLHEVVKQSDQIIKSATISFFQTMHMQTAPLPQYASHVKQLQRGDEPETQYDFEPYISNNSWWVIPDSNPAPTPFQFPREGGRGHQLHKSWPTAIAETKGSLESGPTASSGRVTKTWPGPRGVIHPNPPGDAGTLAHKLGIDDMTPEISTPTGPFRHMGLSKAAQTHRLRKLRSPSKCRECNSYVYFQGAECEECYLACHKKCLETLAIQCGHKKLQGKLQLFGRDFAQQSRLSSDGVPFIVKKCICEIERRAMKTKGIYRVNGVKTRVEKLCQAFENGKELVELSQAYPHDISNVLKLYLRQLPEPIMPFRMYNSLMGLAKESVQGGAEGRPGKSIAELVDRGPETEKVVVALVTKLRELLKELPSENLSTLKYIVLHLRRIVEVEQENKMTPGNLGIVFGPTLMRPRPTEATVSLSSLVDYPHQARIVEALVTFYPAIFETDGALPENPEDAVREDADAAENKVRGEHFREGCCCRGRASCAGTSEDACQPSDDTDLYLTASAEQAEAAFHEDLYRGEVEDTWPKVGRCVIILYFSFYNLLYSPSFPLRSQAGGEN
uniref:Rho GTPase activating protein 45 n=1 Tax=Podarcis muralis TaxID=64176 RepID=A0A670K881_PODMU